MFDKPVAKCGQRMAVTVDNGDNWRRRRGVAGFTEWMITGHFRKGETTGFSGAADTRIRSALDAAARRGREWSGCEDRLPGDGRRKRGCGVSTFDHPPIAASLFFSVPFPTAAASRIPGFDPAYDAKVLQDVGIATDPAGLIAFFRSRTPSPNDPVRLAARIRQSVRPRFGNATGPVASWRRRVVFALPLLRPALSSTVSGVARCAANCIDEIEQAPTAMILASAARSTAAARPAGATEALLGVLPRSRTKQRKMRYSRLWLPSA